MSERSKTRNCCKQFWRWTFLILNVLILLIGLGLFIFGIYLLASQNNLDFLTGTEYASGGVLILIAGFISFVIALIGVLAAAGMWPVLFIIYIVCMFVIVILEIVAGILGFVFRDALAQNVTTIVERAIRDYRGANATDRRNDVNGFVDLMQNQFRCCGYTSFTDWTDTTFVVNNSGGRLPSSCDCRSMDNSSCISVTLSELISTDATSGSSQDLATQNIWQQSCNESVVRFFSNNLGYIAGVGTAFGVFEILAIIVAIALTVCACQDRKDKDKDKDYNNDFAKAY